MHFVHRLFARARPPRELIGPPDPISNIRPIIVSGHRPHPVSETHPYSLSEFSTKDEDDGDLQWRIERERLNAFNHTFWSDSNTRFMRGKQQALERFKGQEPTVREKEMALSAFYSAWTVQESAHQAEYTAEWNRRNQAVIGLAIRRQLQLWKNSFRDVFIRRTF